MEKEIILLKCGEMVLKGLNRFIFEDVLLRNIKHKLRGMGEFSLRSAQSTIYVEPKGEVNISAVVEELKKVFGIINITRAAVCEKNYDSIREKAISCLKEPLDRARTFKVESRRADKKFPMKSPELSAEIGGALLEAYPHLKADMAHPDITVKIEVRDFAAYVSAGDEKGAGGMPYGTAGKGMLLLSGGIDSPVAGYMMAKRGMHISAVHFHSFPFTSEQAKEKVISLAKIVSAYTNDEMHFNVVPFTKIQTELKKYCPEDYLTLCMRRCMMEIASKLAVSVGAEVLVTGESLGQVASQTLKGLIVSEDASEIPVFRPLIGMDKNEIVKISQTIGTFETSILPFEDCCTVFTPRHPKTKPEVPEVREIMERVPCLEELIQEALEGIELIKVKYKE